MCTFFNWIRWTKIACLSLLFVFIFSSATAQRERAMNWVMPTNCGINFSGGTLSNFTANINGAVLSQGSSTISDEDGNLVFYSNGEKAWNYLHQEIAGGGSLLGNKEATQSSLIVPHILNPDRYYLFTMDDNGVGDGLNYYTVDMSLNNGEGLVLPPTQLATNVTEKLCATKHANDIDYWVLTHKWQSDSFLAFHVDSFGVDPIPIVSTVGMSHTGNTNSAMGQMKVSPDGTKIAIASLAGGHIELLSFNNATGEVNAPLLIESYLSNFPFGVEFSADSRKLYYTQRYSAVPEAILYQYDLDFLDTNCLLNSKFELAQINELKVPSNLQLGTNGKIYMTVNYFPTYDTLAVINEPNKYGAAANFDEFGHTTNSTVREGLPNFVSTYVSDGIHVEFGTTCEGASTTMWPADSISPDSVTWNFGDTASSSNSSADMRANHVYSHSDTFLITLYAHEGGITDTFFRNVIIWDTITDILGNDTSICNGSGSITLDASWHNACHRWSTGATSSTISINTGGIYWVDVLYQSCSFRDSISIADVNTVPQFSLGPDTSVCGSFNFELDPDLPNVFYTWNDGSHDTILTITATGTYSLTATNACGDSSDEINVTINTLAQPVLNFPSDTTICDSSELEFEYNFQDASYLWNDGISTNSRIINTTGEYWLRISNVCDTVSDTINVLVESELESALDLAYLLCDETDAINLIATTDSSQVTWMDGSISSQFIATDSGIVSFSGSNTCNSIQDSVQILKWDSNIQFFAGSDTLLCEAQATVNLGYTGEDYLFSYLWSNDSTNRSITVSQGTYVVSATNICATVVDTVSVAQAEQIFMSASDSNVCDGDRLVLRPTSNGIQSIEWWNGETSIEAIAIDEGLKWFSLIDTNQCVFSDSIFITSICPPKVLIANVFTPNGDNINDTFCAEMKNVSSFQFFIHNRWGSEVFESSTESCWDGKIRGSLASNGTYFYTIITIGNDGVENTFRGSLSLIR